MKLATLVTMMRGEWVSTPTALTEFVPYGYSIDSRTIKPGELFFAVKGENFDGHQFVVKALEHGACAAVVSQLDPALVQWHSRIIRVADPLQALQQLAHWVLKDWSRPIIGITGSAGKTTAKELTALVLSATGSVLKSRGNLNNTFGLPLSVLQMESHGRHSENFDFAVLEMGMSSYGEIARLCEIAPPDVGAVLNVGTAHIEFFGSREAIATAKAELISGIRPGGLAVLNADDPLVAAMRTRHQGPVKTFGIEHPADIQATAIRDRGVWGTKFYLKVNNAVNEQATVSLPLAGKHFIYNALLAATIGSHFGLSASEIAVQLNQARPAAHRGEVLQFAPGFVVVDDCYNSNPEALIEASQLIARSMDFPRRIIIAGEMLELGENSAKLHQQCGAALDPNNIHLVVGVRGQAAEFIAGARQAGFPAERTLFLPDAVAATAWLRQTLQPGDLVLIKGSRGVKMETIIEALQAEYSQEAQ
jgi:UDP-N-acetylmuramoyl-tripeptide--D-alanyl-D-alanine ligase